MNAIIFATGAFGGMVFRAFEAQESKEGADIDREKIDQKEGLLECSPPKSRTALLLLLTPHRQ